MQNNLTKNKKIQTCSGGFTLVEVVLVMVVTAIVFIAIYGLYANTVKQDLETRYEIMASNLAQEGVEIIRNVRDEDQLFDPVPPNPTHPINHSFPHPHVGCKPFFSGNNGVCDGSKNIKVEYDGAKYVNCAFGGCGASETPFSRECDVLCDDTCGAGDPNCNLGDCIRMTVTCTVSWDSFVNPALNRSVDAVSVLTSWQE